MIAIVANLGTSTNPQNLVGRPLGASIGLLLVVILTCRFLVRPLGRKWILYKRTRQEKPSWKTWFTGSRIAFVVHTLLLFGFVTVAAWVGTSILFSAFLCGASITWWDARVAGNMGNSSEIRNEQLPETSPAEKEASLHPQHNPALPCIQDTTGLLVYERYYHAVVDRILKPLFFVSPIFSPTRTKVFLLTLHFFRHPLAFPFPSRNCLARACLYSTHVLFKDLDRNPNLAVHYHSKIASSSP